MIKLVLRVMVRIVVIRDGAICVRNMGIEWIFGWWRG